LPKVSFGIFVPQMSLQYATIRRMFIDAEEVGFESAWLADHFIPYDYPDRPITEPMLECWTTLASLATQTKKIRFGALVSCNSFRPPQLLAKITSTLDVISEGRVNFAIGAGWLQLEHEQYGYEFPAISKRIEKLNEAINIIRLLWTKEKASFAGKYYAIKEAVNSPRPVQKPRPPIYVGAERRTMIKFAAQYADVWNFPSDINPYTPQDYAQRVNILESQCDKIGRNPLAIKRSWLGLAILGKNEDDVARKISSIRPKGLSKEQSLREIVGTAETCLHRIGEYVDLGVSEFILIFPETYTSETLREFYDNIIEKV
jgi:F420-dependent oxidoreductase-like protein